MQNIENLISERTDSKLFLAEGEVREYNPVIKGLETAAAAGITV
jgi:hypothetical protein